MLFYSSPYAAFLIAVAGVHWLLPHRARWVWLLAASYFFYATWNPAFLWVLLCLTAVDYVAAVHMASVSRTVQQFLLWFVICLHVGLLAFLKYGGFLTESTILLPLGISFFSLQALGYVIDVYRGSIKPEKHVGYLALYIAFFPQLIAGPIERAGNVLPQLRTNRSLRDWMVLEGFQLILWGVFLKVVIADNMALYVNSVYDNVTAFTGLPLWLATYFFAIQLLCDFAGYSAIAIGSARLVGIRLLENFRRPYLATSIADFWNRWHISLSSWLRDYIYIPLGGNRKGRPRQLLNIVITFFVSGLWHGTGWTFVLWGLLHGVFLCVQRIFDWQWPNRSQTAIAKCIAGFITFHAVCFTWIFFRANSVHDAWYVITHLVGDFSVTSLLQGIDISGPIFALCLLLVTLLIVEMVTEEKTGHVSQVFARLPSWLRWLSYYGLLFGILFLAANRVSEFIYFRF